MNNIRDYRTFPIFGSETELFHLDELKRSIVHEDDHLLVFNKPGWIVCHPSKNGPLSSLIGAAREYTKLDTLHLVSRLDRETSGVVILAKDKNYARILQGAIENRFVAKVYYAVLEGFLKKPVYINQSLAQDLQSPVYVKVRVCEPHQGQTARSYFEPLTSNQEFTLVRIILDTGRKHQIRAHAEWLGHKIVGDKIYGPDANLFLEFAQNGWTDNLEQSLPMRRQALHAFKMTFNTSEFSSTFVAPLAWDFCQFCEHRMGINAKQIQEFQNLPDLAIDLFESLNSW